MGEVTSVHGALDLDLFVESDQDPEDTERTLQALREFATQTHEAVVIFTRSLERFSNEMSIRVSRDLSAVWLDRVQTRAAALSFRDASGMAAEDYAQEDLVDKIDFVLDRYREERG